MRHFSFLLCLFLVLAGDAYSKAPSWEKLTGCTLVTKAWRDGDSFHVKHNDQEYIFRLYFVDTPEDETRFPDRVAQQAEYFGVTSEQSLQLGRAASEYTYKILDGKSFTVWTCWQDALGASAKKRFYALVDVNGAQLDELLVSNGLARIYGKRITLPDGTTSRIYLTKLRELESQAKARKEGGWAQSTNLGGESPVGSKSEAPAF